MGVEIRGALVSILGQDRDVPPYVRRDSKIVVQVDALEPALQTEQPDQKRRGEGMGQTIVEKGRDLSRVDGQYKHS